MGHVMKIALIALIFEGFSIDSFALPYIWINLWHLQCFILRIQPGQ